MCCRKFLNFIINSVIPYSVLYIFLLQIYAQYSTLVTLRTKIDSKRDGRHTISNYQLTKDKQYDFNMNKLQECFEENALMNIKFLKDSTLKLFEMINNKNENNDIRVYMFYYLFLYDFICLIIVYLFIYENIKAGIIKIIFQIIRFYFNAKKMQKFNNNISLFSIIKNKIDNMYLIRGWNIFNPESFFIIEFLCNFVIILDIFLLIIYIRRNKNNKINKQKNIFKYDKDNSIDEDDIDKKPNVKISTYNKPILHKNIGNDTKCNILDNLFITDEQDEEEEDLSEEYEHKDNKQETKE